MKRRQLCEVLRNAYVVFSCLYYTFFATFLSAIDVMTLECTAFTSVSHGLSADLPVILWWTGRLFPHIDVNRTIINCSKSSCITTNDKMLTRFDDVSVFLFYGSDLQIEDMPLPRLPHHMWALFHEESPLNNFFFSHSKGIRLFNYTATFRRESDYPLTTQFIPSVSYLLDQKPYPLNQKNALRQKGFAPVIYVQSHCHVPSDRDRYVHELSKYVPIDSYGSCLHNKDLPPELASTEKYNDEAFLDFISHYKFHLAFENALCNDYVTEKLYRALHVGSVPIYRGAPTVKDWLPSNRSAIVVDDFDSPYLLAQYILLLDANDKLYEEYLEYKIQGLQNPFLKEVLDGREWGVNDFNKVDFFQGFECYICDQITKGDFGGTTPCNAFQTPKVANSSHMGCPEPHVSYLEKGVKLASNDEWLKQEWAEAYWFSYDQARALEKMILTNESDSTKIYDISLNMKFDH